MPNLASRLQNWPQIGSISNCLHWWRKKGWMLLPFSWKSLVGRSVSHGTFVARFKARQCLLLTEDPLLLSMSNTVTLGTKFTQSSRSLFNWTRLLKLTIWLRYIPCSLLLLNLATIELGSCHIQFSHNTRRNVFVGFCAFTKAICEGQDTSVKSSILKPSVCKQDYVEVDIIPTCLVSLSKFLGGPLWCLAQEKTQTI